MNQDEKTAACKICLRAGAAFVKTATGFGAGGAVVEDVQLMRELVGASMGIKAAGGIRTFGDAMRLVEAGATCIGTSAGVSILEDAPA